MQTIGFPFIDLIRDDLEQTEALLRERPAGQHEAIGAALEQLIGGGGKRMRPMLTLLSARQCDAEMQQAIYAAAAVEMLHTATLIHDDLVDGSLVRRGVGTLNASWTPGATVLTGDYVFARAAHLVSMTDNVLLMRRFAETLMIVCNGEVRQLFNNRRGRISCQEYEQRIYAKTASLIALSAEAGAILSAASPQTREVLRTYGEHLGLAFQVVDDVLDFIADEETLGKPVGSDLRQGLLTLPALCYLEEHPDDPAIPLALESPSEENVRRAVQAVADSPAIEQAIQTARQYAGQATEALTALADTPYRTALLELADFTICRRF